MNNEQTIENNIRQALDSVRKSERNYRLTMGGIFLWEIVLLAMVVLFVDFSNDLHVLILISTLVMYGTVGIGLFALGTFNQRNTAKILKAIQSR